MEIMLFSIFSGILDRFLGFRCVLHKFYYWLSVTLRIDNSDLEALCTWWCVFNDIFAVYESIWA